LGGWCCFVIVDAEARRAGEAACGVVKEFIFYRNGGGGGGGGGKGLKWRSTGRPPPKKVLICTPSTVQSRRFVFAFHFPFVSANHRIETILNFSSFC
jgi:hypothetical protein